LKLSNIQKKLYWKKCESRVHYCWVVTIFHEIPLRVEKLYLFNVTYYGEFLSSWEVIKNSYSKWPELQNLLMGVNGHVGESFCFSRNFWSPTGEIVFCRFTNQLRLGNGFLSEQFDHFDVRFRNSAAEILEFQSSKTVFKLPLEVVFLFL